MIRTFLTLTASAAALALATPALAQDDAVSDAPQMTFGTWGVDPTLLDNSVNPGDNFYDYVNAKWIAANPIPAEYSRFSSFNFLDNKSKDSIKTLIDDLVASRDSLSPDEQRIVDAYNAYADTDAIDARGMAAAQPYLNEIFAAKDLTSIVELVAQTGIPSLVSAGIGVDDKDPDSYIANVGFDGMGLPDRDYYLVDSEVNRNIQAKYKELLTFMLGKAGYQDPAAAAEAVYAFEHKVAELEWARAALRNSDLTYHKLSKSELKALAPEFPVDEFFEAKGLSSAENFLAPQIPPTEERAKELGLDQKTLDGIGGGLPAMMKLLADTPLATLKAYLAAHFLSGHASVLPSDIDQANFDFFSKVLSGAQEQQPRWKRAINATQAEVGELLGKVYVQHYFPASSKASMENLVANLRAALGASIAQDDWMGDETKAKAQAKLAAFFPKIGYPDQFKEYAGLVISPDDPLANSINAGKWNYEYDLARIDQPVDRSEWFMLPQTVNAYYSPSMNQIVFPAAILQPPFFNPDADLAVNYGAIGAVIGHEMGHGFDDQGSKYDPKGKLENWWTDKDRAAFEAKTDQLVDQYDHFCPLDEGKTCVNGRLTLGENIGDLSGVTIAYKAYKAALGGKEAPVIDGLTGDQRFFLAYAQVWRSVQRPESLRRQMKTDPHSPAQYRVNGILPNVDAWYAAFDIKPGDAMYLPPEKRVHIW